MKVFAKQNIMGLNKLQILEEFDGDHAVEGTVPAVVRPGGLERVSVDVRSGAVVGARRSS